VVVFGGVQSLMGTVMSAFSIAQSQSWLEYFMSGSMAKMTMLAIVIVVLYFKPSGLFTTRVRA
jgi:urea transport system permease protein